MSRERGAGALARPGECVRRFVGVALAPLLIVALGAGPVGASESPDGDASAPSSALPHQSTAAVDVDKGDQESKHFWVWSAGRRAYYLRQPLFATHELVSVDLDSGESREATLAVPAYDNPYTQDAAQRASGTERTMAVDEAQGRLFVATRHRGAQTFVTADAAQGVAHETARASTCAQVTLPSMLLRCFSGISVVDAESLEHVRHIPFRSVQAEAAIVSPQLIAMEYSPPVGELAGKVHVLLHDYGSFPAGLDGQTSNVNPRRFGNVTYLAQFDPDSGTQDWVIRLDACRGNRPGRGTTDHKRVEGIPHQAALFRGRTAGDDAVYVACWATSSSLTGAVVRVPLSVTGLPALPEPSSESIQLAPPERLDFPVDRPYAVEGPDEVMEFLADPDSGRFALQVMDGRPLAQVWWVFDTTVMQFVGTIGIGGPVLPGSSMSTIARGPGRLYVLADAVSSDGRQFKGGLFTADLRRTPVPQALHFPELESMFRIGRGPTAVSYDGHRFGLEAQDLGDGVVRLWMPGTDPLDSAIRRYHAIDDLRGPHVGVPVDDSAGRTLDLAEAEGVTSVSADGAARGYGFRALIVGGAEAMARVGPLDPVGNVASCNDEEWDIGTTIVTGGPCAKPMLNGIGGKTPLPMGCFAGNREVVLAAVGPQGPAVVDATGARGAAQPVLIDSLTRTDADAPASRCTGTDWDALWGRALFGRAPAAEPGAGGLADGVVAQCVSSDTNPSDQVGDPVLDGGSAAVRCRSEGASGYAHTRGGTISDVDVAEAFSSFRIYRDPARGIVSRVESVARGLNIAGVLRIDTVRGVAESWANGRAQSVTAADRPAGYDPNCDIERTAGTCFQRQLFGVWTPGYECGPCGDEQAFVQGVNTVVNPNALVRLRDPDQRLRRGAENGFTAAIQKAEHERFADLALNTDVLQTVLPTLEVIRFAAPNRYASRSGPRGRQIYQFAGVEVSSSYSIQCLLIYDEATGTCSEPPLSRGSLTVALTDPAGDPLAGGAFEVRRDADGDGVLGLVDELIGEGACVTAQDGTGTCTFADLDPGSYLVSQTAAPPGYSAVTDPWLSDIAPGEARTVTFTNVSDASSVELTVTDADGRPVEGATFAVYADPDGDGRVAPDSRPVATCTSDDTGVCAMTVPSGSYVLVQTAARDGLRPVEPIAFTFASGGQTAAVGVTNGPADVTPPESAPAPAPTYTAPIGFAPTEVLDPSSGVAAPAEPTPRVDVRERVGGTVVQVIRAPGDALRLLARDPLQVLGWTASLAILALAGLAVRRRTLLRTLAATAFARNPQ